MPAYSERGDTDTKLNVTLGINILEFLHTLPQTREKKTTSVLENAAVNMEVPVKAYIYTQVPRKLEIE